MSGDRIGIGVYATSSGGADAMARRLDAMVRRGRNRAQAYALLGHHTMNLVQQGLRENVGGWPSPSAWPRGYRRGGQPLRDTGRLRNSIAYRSSANGMAAGTNVKYARVLNRGGIIRPRGRFLLLPLSPPLTPSQVRAWPQGAAAIRAAYPGSFFLFGPEGPGIYRKSRVRSATAAQRKERRRLGLPRARWQPRTKTIERIAAAVRSAKVPAFGYLMWRPPWVRYLSQKYVEWYVGQGGTPTFPSSGGSPAGRKG